jgi:galactokinase
VSLIATLLGHGLSEGDARSRAALLERVTRGFIDTTGAAPAWRWMVPGRLEIFGKHTDYAGGRSLLAAVPRGFAVAAGRRDDGLIHATDLRRRERTTIDAGASARPCTGWASYLQVTARRLAANFPGAALGLDLVFESDLPPAAGLSSSSALVVATATALAARGEIEARDEWQANVRSLEDRATYFGCIENGQTFRGLAGASGVGTQGGSEDHTAILGCRAGVVSLFRFVPVTRLADIPWPAGWTFVVAGSGVHADKAGAVRERFNRMAAAARALLALSNAAAGSRATSLAMVLPDADAIVELRRLASRASVAGFTADELVARLDHFAAEDALAHEAAVAIAHGDLDRLRDASRRSQRLAESTLGNQVPETRALALLAHTCGAHAASSFGAGFGGSVWALVHTPEADAFAAAWAAAYRRQLPEVPRAESFTCAPAAGVLQLPSGAGAPAGGRDGRAAV